VRLLADGNSCQAGVIGPSARRGRRGDGAAPTDKREPMLTAPARRGNPNRVHLPRINIPDSGAPPADPACTSPPAGACRRRRSSRGRGRRRPGLAPRRPATGGPNTFASRSAPRSIRTIRRMAALDQLTLDSANCANSANDPGGPVEGAGRERMRHLHRRAPDGGCRRLLVTVRLVIGSLRRLRPSPSRPTPRSPPSPQPRPPWPSSPSASHPTAPGRSTGSGIGPGPTAIRAAAGLPTAVAAAPPPTGS
jgi:hypothetical protein